MGAKPRRVPLPVLSTVSEEDRLALQDVIQRFISTARRWGFHKPTEALDNCMRASSLFIQEARKHDLKIEMRYYTGDDLTHYSYNASTCVTHYANRLGDLIIDWTARQFNKHAPFPAIWIDKRQECRRVYFRSCFLET